MEILKIVGLAICSCALIVFLQKDNKDYAMLLSVVSGVIIFMMIISYIYPIIEIIATYSLKANIESFHLKSIFKIIATGYIAQFGSEICADSGQSALSSKIELVAKIMIIYFSLPILITLFEYIGAFI